ncbi:hypothetical protein BBJ28_00014911 [Nothophytophthora sp. Chile5]|nr:hypothetical protein BBJ28_00014911 [Nothophytophthora sp. Chile5]
MSSPPVDAAVQRLLEAHEYLELVEVGEGDAKRPRVKCQLTQHEMMPRAADIEAHLASKKFVKARDWYCHDYSQYEPYIVPHRRLTKSLFCNVTGTILNRIPDEVEKHVRGKKYQRMKAHVKISVKRSKDDDDMDGNGGAEEFDADAFEFENSQVVFSDAEEEEDDATPAADKTQSDAQVKKKEKEDDDDMADLYPDDDESGEDVEKKEKAEDADEAMETQKPRKKRTAKGNAAAPKKHRHHTKKTKTAA